ncbi:MAG TPA: hypothetical protein GXX77_02115 [Candidatus Cloacimonetes bacterium]|nr:hypothetical protein [Candidatus Cloacimonadota bacterium]
MNSKDEAPKDKGSAGKDLDRLDGDRAFRAKKSFIANISHEIRTPMNAIMGFAQMLKNSDLSEEQDEYVDVIIDSGTKLLSIIHSLLELSNLETGEAAVKPVICDMYLFFSRLWQNCEMQIKSKQLDPVLELPSELPKVIIDEDKLERVLDLLISNAVKFTGSGMVQLSVEMESDDDEYQLVINVCDTGCGIAPHRMRTIYDIFEQGDSGITRTHSGLGLGLSIVSRLVELMGGDILASSVVGAGTCFKLILPVEIYKEYGA